MENRSEGTLTGARKASVLDCLYVRAELVLEVTWKRWILATRLPACYISKMGKMGPTKSPDEVNNVWPLLSVFNSVCTALLFDRELDLRSE